MNLIMFELNGSESRYEWGIRSLILKRVKMYQNLTALCWKIRRTTAGRIVIRSMCFFLNGLYLFIVIIDHILLITLCYLHYTTFVHELYFDMFLHRKCTWNTGENLKIRNYMMSQGKHGEFYLDRMCGNPFHIKWYNYVFLRLRRYYFNWFKMCDLLRK